MVTTARWLRIKEVFNEVSELSNSKRTHRLEELCGGDPELLREVGSLLLADDRASGFIGDDPQAVPTAPPPATIGSFRIVREVGRGGMGVVYLAERAGDFAQRVAIKVINAGLAHAEHVLKRFRAEREILARLEHPNVARLLDGGTTPEGLPYFVMEYVEGTPIDRYCRQRDLPLRERLELFLRVCAPVQYAHQNLVIHRDLKPGNILIAADGTPKLLDFGIAKVLDDSETPMERTATEHRAMTPEYASPEQMLGQPLATTTDVYSLGVVLFELLTDQKPRRFASSSPAEIARVALEAEPPKPSAVLQRTVAGDPRAVRGDLDNIVQMALRREPARRYASVQALADDIRRHLDGLPVSARPDTLRYRAVKFVRRNRFAAAASLLLVLALLSGIAATSWQAVQARRSQQKAERRFAQLRKLAKALIFDLDAEISTLTGSTSARQKLVSTALVYLDSLAAEADDPGLQLELGVAYQRIGEIQGNSYYSNLGQTAAARISYDKSRRILEALAARRPDDRDVLQSLARAYMGLGDIEHGGGHELQQANALYRRSIDLWNRAARLARLDRAETRTFALVIARQADLLGMPGYSNLGRFDEAVAAHRRALEIREDLLRRYPNEERVARDVAESLTKVSYLANSAGDFELASKINQRAVELMTQLAAKNPDSANDQHDLSFALMSAAFPLRDLGRWEEGAESLRRSRAVMEKLAERDPASVLYRRNLSVINNHLSSLLADAGRPEEALEASMQSIALAENLVAADPENRDARLDYVISLRRAVEAWLALGQYDSVLRHGRALAMAEELAKSGNQRAAFEQALLEARFALAASRVGRAAEAERRLQRARSLLDEQIARGATDARTRDELALTSLYRGEALGDCAGYRAALKTWEELSTAKSLPFRSRRHLERARTAAAGCRPSR